MALIAPSAEVTAASVLSVAISEIPRLKLEFPGLIFKCQGILH